MHVNDTAQAAPDNERFPYTGMTGGPAKTIASCAPDHHRARAAGLRGGDLAALKAI